MELNECADSDPAVIKKLLAKHSMKNKFAPDPTFATSPICITDLNLISLLIFQLYPQLKLTPFMAEKMMMLLHT